MNFFIYIRVSTCNQDLTKSLDECLKYCVKNKIKNYKIITSTSSSRKSQKERKITELLNSVQSGDTVLTTELSRLGRNVNENREIFMEFYKKNITIRFTRESHNILTDKRLGGLLFEVFSLFSEMEREMISERTRNALRAIKDKGVKLGRPKRDDYVNSGLLSQKDSIKYYMNNHISLSAMSRMLKVHPLTLKKFIASEFPK